MSDTFESTVRPDAGALARASSDPGDMVKPQLETSPVAGSPPAPFIRRMLFGASASAILQASSSALAFLVAVALARLLGTRDYGYYVFALAWASALTIPAGLGLNRFVVRGVAEYEVNQQWSHLRGLLTRANTIVAVTASAIAAGGVIIALTTVEAPLRWVLALAMVLIPINALTILRQNTMQAFGRIVAGQIPEYVIRPIMIVIGIGLLAVVGGRILTPLAAMVVYVTAATTALVVGALALRRTIPERVRTAVPQYQRREWILAALPMMLIGGIWQLNGYVSTIAVGMLGGAQEAGIYNVVEKGAGLVVLLLIAANMPFAPLVARMRAIGDRAGMEHGAERIAQATVIASLPIVIFLVAFPDVYLGLFGAEFDSGDTALRVLALGQLFNAAAGPVGSVLIMTGHERKACWGVGLGLLTTVILSIALIPSFGVTGAAIADAASFVVWNVALNVLCRRSLSINATAFPRLAMATAGRNPHSSAL
jgi:O-antigen/teichoic acid export membrane protein